MKDLIAKLQLDANCALGAIWMHMDSREAQIAKLEEENAALRAASDPAVIESLEKGPTAYLGEYKDSGNKTLFFANFGTVSDTDNLTFTALYPAPTASTALQAPVREVPGPVRNFLIEVAQQRPEKPDYWSECGQCGTRRDQADELLEQFPAAPVQEPKP